MPKNQFGIDYELFRPDGHVSSDALVEFEDGRLTGMDRQQVIKHLLNCQECREILAEDREFAQSEEYEEVVRQLTRTIQDWIQMIKNWRKTNPN